MTAKGQILRKLFTLPAQGSSAPWWCGRRGKRVGLRRQVTVMLFFRLQTNRLLLRLRVLLLSRVTVTFLMMKFRRLLVLVRCGTHWFRKRFVFRVQTRPVKRSRFGVPRRGNFGRVLWALMVKLLLLFLSLSLPRLLDRMFLFAVIPVMLFVILSLSLFCLTGPRLNRVVIKLKFWTFRFCVPFRG